MRSLFHLTMLILTLTVVLQCSQNKAINRSNPEPLSSVKIVLRDGSVRQGIIFKSAAGRIVYVDAKSHRPDSLAISSIKSIKRLPVVYDFEAREIPAAEIKEAKKHKYMFLYGLGGFILGGAAGWGISIFAFPKMEYGWILAIFTIDAFSAAGVGAFAYFGNQVDNEAAIPNARKARFKKLKKLVEEEKKIQQLKKEKKELLHKIKLKKKSKKVKK